MLDREQEEDPSNMRPLVTWRRAAPTVSMALKLGCGRLGMGEGHRDTAGAGEAFMRRKSRW